MGVLVCFNRLHSVALFDQLNTMTLPLTKQIHSEILLSTKNNLISLECILIPKFNTLHILVQTNTKTND